AAAEAATGPRALFNTDVRTVRDVELFLQQSRRAQAQVDLLGHGREVAAVAQDPAVPAGPQVHGVAPVEDAEDRLQLVVAVRAAARDLQEQVELGRRGPGRPAIATHGSSGPQRSITRRTPASPRCASIRRGSAGMPASAGSQAR